MLTAVILTKNEEIHIERALASISTLVDRCFVVDSGSNDETISLAKAAGAQVLENSWINYAAQFNWALDQLPSDTQWILRLDADEIVTDQLAKEIREKLASVPASVSGINVSRRMCFLRRPIRWGGLFPIRVVRLFRYRQGRVENRWMDEHIVVDGPTHDFYGEIVDDNLNPLSWWTEKHNAYASREVVDLLNLELQFIPSDTIADLSGGGQAGAKRWIKERLYRRLPIGMRALAYFTYRYVIRLGFLDGREGAAFHVLQGFWYRFLIDMKLYEVRTYMRTNQASPIEAIRAVLGIDVK